MHDVGARIDGVAVREAKSPVTEGLPRVELRYATVAWFRRVRDAAGDEAGRRASRRPLIPGFEVKRLGIRQYRLAASRRIVCRVVGGHLRRRWRRQLQLRSWCDFARQLPWRRRVRSEQ